MSEHGAEVARGERFKFGKNWQGFLSTLDDERITRAEDSLRDMLDVGTLEGRSFVDVGSGSGLFSLAARRLGARVHSFDYDPEAVACTEELRQQYFPDDAQWQVESGSALDRKYLTSLGKFDVVYSWGVLHHTGDMWRALGNVAPMVADNGKLMIAIYNDQGAVSRRWTALKRLYNKSCGPLKFLLVLGVGFYQEARTCLSRLVRLRNPLPFGEWREYKKRRGMSRWHDLVDWVGGYPFEVAKPDEILDFYRRRGFELERLRTCRGSQGCNEFVFTRRLRRPADAPTAESTAPESEETT